MTTQHTPTTQTPTPQTPTTRAPAPQSAPEGAARRGPWEDRLAEIAPRIAAQAARHDAEGSFVSDNTALLKAQGFFSLGVPRALGGGGASHADLCALVRRLGRLCGSTALAFSMHTHLVAAAVWRWRHGQPAEALLRRVADEELVLVSTGAADWLQSNGTLTRVEGGYRFDATKICCSGSPAGDLMITSGAFPDGEAGPEVLHFALPLSSAGITCLEDWDTLGMRGTGSHSWVLKNVFVPDAAVALRRPQEGWHPSWSVVLTVALPLILSAYVGVAEAACGLVRSLWRDRPGPRPYGPLGAMETELAAARMALEGLIANAADYDFEPSLDRANAALVRKTLAGRACLAAVDLAMEAGGGATFARRTGFERLFRDVQGCRFHPLPAARQAVFTGRHAMGDDPLGPAS